MLNVEISKNLIRIKGHAGYAEHGKDIVCSAVSVLAQVLLHEIQVYTEAEYSEKSGDLTLEIFQRTPQSDILYIAFVRGITQIARQYPEYVKIFDNNIKTS